jgi:hypothetical protein
MFHRNDPELAVRDIAKLFANSDSYSLTPTKTKEKEGSSE